MDRNLPVVHRVVHRVVRKHPTDPARQGTLVGVMVRAGNMVHLEMSLGNQSGCAG